MTREEIIEQLKLAIDLIKQDGKDWLDDRDIPMLEECVKVLSQKPCDECKYRTFTELYFHTDPEMIEQESKVTDRNGNYIYPSDIVLDEPNIATACVPTIVYPQVDE